MSRTGFCSGGGSEGNQDEERDWGINYLMNFVLKKKKKKTLPSLESPRELHSFSNTGYACIKKIYAALLKPKIKQ